jgi:Tfp pilus assembly protein PilF
LVETVQENESLLNSLQAERLIYQALEHDPRDPEAVCALATFVGKSRGDFSSAEQLYTCAPTL